MGTIKRLPESVRNSMRSGIILFDLTRVVEELVFNSLDAGASKVSVYVGVGTGYVKVVDDGCGISRDGLVLLGQRYVTSKLHHLADMDAANESFGFRGEALASISDVSLLEIITKARGRPNGYHKVLKGSKCLYLGINDDRKDVGTTVVVRDLFYNQPVRRKCMQSSLKKVLDSVKKCILRIAFVHSEVSFRVIDIDSEDELLYVRPSTALSLLMSSFGIEDPNFLHELDGSSGLLKLSGYISGPCDSLIIKAFQYVYINSRFVSKGPIHKLLNNLATKFESLDPWKANSMPHKGKRLRPQACPAFILNLSCPLALYDLTFEPSKTHVEFKDWLPILDFIQNSIQRLWTGNMTYGKLLGHETGLCTKDRIRKEDFKENAEFAINKHEIEKQKSFHYLSCPQFKVQTENGDSSLSKHVALQKSESHLFTSDDSSFLLDDCFLEDRVTSALRSSDHVEGRILGLDWQHDSSEFRSLEIDESSKSAFSMDYHKFGDELEVTKNNDKPFLQSCSSRRKLSLDGSLFSSEEGIEFPVDGYKTKRRRVRTNEDVDILKVDAKNNSFNILPGTSQQHAASCSQKFSAHSMGVHTASDFDTLAGASAKSFSFHGELCAEENGLGSGSVVLINNSGSGSLSFNSEWCLPTSDALLRTTSWDVDSFGDDNRHEGIDILDKNANHRHFADDQGRNCSYSYNVRSKCSSQENFISSCTSTAFDLKECADTGITLDFNDCAVSRKDISTFFFQGHNLHDGLSPEHSKISLPETEWSPLEFHSRGQKGHDKYECKESHTKFQDWEQENFPKERPRRSQSAPPFYKHKRRFVSLSHSMIKEGNAHDGHISPEIDDSKHLYFRPNYGEDSMLCTRSNVKNREGMMMDIKEIKEGEKLKCLQNTWVDDSPVEGLNQKEIHKSKDHGPKWQNGSQQIAKNGTSSNIDNQHNILNISSGFLRIAGNSLIPESLHKNCLEDAKVLQQVDKKFIPIVASGTLAIIDQHAADERIRLEELRQKLSSGDARTVTYLDAEKELVLPEIGYQLLQNYATQIRDWGWICNIHAHSGSFKKNMNILRQQPTVVTLLAVPCILGVNLSDGDLLEFLQQLADTDGSSTMPQSVLRVLNFKACRGAIMFGDSLLPSECALIVEELKQTSLCFQCAHGRPTTVPLVNLMELHKQIHKLRALDGETGELWHGLRRQELSFERAAQRLSSARN